MTRRCEDGSTIVLGMLALFIISLIVLFVATMTVGSIATQRKKTERSVGMAAGDSAIEQYRTALQMYLAADHNGYQLNEAALRSLAESMSGDIKVLSNNDTSKKWGMADVLVPGPNQYTVREATKNSYSYWQIYNVIPPRRTEARANDLIVYFRAWGTSKSAGGGERVTTKPRIFRAEYRPTYMSDYQLVSDEPIFIPDNTPLPVLISAPVHSNGYKGPEWLTGDIAGIELRRPVICKDKRARFSTSQTGNEALVNSLLSFTGCDVIRDVTDVNAKKVSLLGAEETFRVMREKCGGGAPYVVCHTLPPAIAGTAKNPPQHQVVLAGNTVIVDGVPYSPSRLPGDNNGDSARIAIHLTGDVRVTGMLSGAGGVATGVTIATERSQPSDPSPTIYLGPGPVGVADPSKDSVGLISGGDIILGLDQPAACVPSVQGVAALAQSGSISIARDLVTVSAPIVDPMTRQCPMPINLDGSFAGHGMLISRITWNQPAGAWMGYLTSNFEYSGALYRNSPPYFTTVSPWGLTKVKDADVRCLTVAKAGDESCE